MNLYEILGLPGDASEADIKRAYRDLSKVHHPDVGGDETKFVEINTAYKILSDAKRRSRYDEDGTFEDEALERSQMQAFMSQGFEVFLMSQAAQREGVNVKEALTESFIEQRAGADKAVAECRTAMKVLEKIKGRITRKDDGDNLFAGIIDHHLAKLAPQIEDIEAKKRIADMAIEEMGNYETIGEAMAALPSRFGSVFLGAHQQSRGLFR